MAQVTGRKVATTPITPTPSGGNVINSWNTSDNKETNAPSMKIVKDGLDEINDNLSKTTISQDTKVILTKNTEYTTLADGYFRIQSELGDRYVTGYINNITVMQLLPKTSSSSGANLESMSIFVRKGTKIKYECSTTSTGASGVFYPLA